MTEATVFNEPEIALVVTRCRFPSARWYWLSKKPIGGPIVGDAVLETLKQNKIPHRREMVPDPRPGMTEVELALVTLTPDAAAKFLLFWNPPENGGDRYRSSPITWMIIQTDDDNVGRGRQVDQSDVFRVLAEQTELLNKGQLA